MGFYWSLKRFFLQKFWVFKDFTARLGLWFLPSCTNNPKSELWLVEEAFQVHSFDLCSMKVGSMHTTTCFYYNPKCFSREFRLSSIILNVVPKEENVHTLPTLLPECRYSTASTTDCTPKNLFGSTKTCREDLNHPGIKKL